MQLQMCLIYFSTAALKACGPAWQDGTYMYYVRDSQFLGGWLPHQWLGMDYTNVLKAMTYATLVLEWGTILLIWFQTTRYWTLAAVLVFHLTIDGTMNLNCFHWAMMIGWSSFLIAPTEPPASPNAAESKAKDD